MQINQTLKDSWHNVKHFKGSAWGGFAFVMLANLLMFLAAAVISLIITPNQGPDGFISLIVKIITDFFVIPLVIGWSLLAVYKLRNQLFAAQRCIVFYKWNLMWRFYTNTWFFILCAAAIIGGFFLIFLLLFPDRISEAPLNTHTGSVANIILLICCGFVVSILSCMMHFANMRIAETGRLIESVKKSACAVIKNYHKIFCLIIVVTFFSAIALAVAYLGMSLVANFAPGIAAKIVGGIILLIPMIWILPWSLLVWGKIYLELL